MADTLSLGGVVFDQFSTPEVMGAGGKQQLVVHKLPGGSRVIDTLGPDEDNIIWSGFFFSDDAFDKVQLLDGMRAAGQVISLSFAGLFRSVIIDNFSWRVRRLPVWVEYQISCTVYQNPALGGLTATAGSIDTLVLSDLAQAIGL